MSGKRRDWFRILRDLQKAGVGYRDVARKCNRHVAAVHNWAESGEPKDSDAQTILALYAKHCPVEYEAHMQTRDMAERIHALTEPGETFTLPFAPRSSVAESRGNTEITSKLGEVSPNWSNVCSEAGRRGAKRER